MQLLMSEGTEFGSHEGLGFIKGIVVRLNNPATEAGALKVPQIGWNQLFRNKELSSNPWADTPLKGLPDGVYMYFNHSYYVIPENTKAVIAKSTYGNITFCSALRQENIIALQCHPERSGAYGLAVYQNLYRMIEHSM
jgi:glutamine amidotransferase